jgi:hypothetical protein
MSDGITESRRGTYFSKNKIPTHDPQTGDKNPHYGEMEEDENPYKVKFVPDPRMHQYISFTKSTIRIIGYILIPFNLVVATGILILSELVGIIEELV